jgi:drug/metabolite transporter (DMT)-like permease
VAAVLSSLYPATTVLLARWILNERLTWGQTAGLLAALVAIAAITIP